MASSVCVFDPRTWDESTQCPPIRCSVLRCTRCTVSKASVEVPSMFQGARLVEAMNKFPSMSDVVGLEAAKAEVNRFLSRSKTDVERAKKFLLLVGVSGTGKSMLAKAATKKLVQDTGAVYFYIQPDTISIRDKNVDPLKALDELFEEAVKSQPSVVVIEFIDSVIPKTSKGAGNQELQHIKSKLAHRCILHLRQLQYESQVYVIGVTAHPSDMRHAALRLFRHGVVYCPPPSGTERSELLRIFLEKINFTLSDDQLISIGFSPKASRFSRWDMRSLVNDITTQPLKKPNLQLTKREEVIYLRNVIHGRVQEALRFRDGSIRKKEILKLHHVFEVPMFPQ